jgi:hypothetical protein
MQGVVVRSWVARFHRQRTDRTPQERMIRNGQRILEGAMGCLRERQMKGAMERTTRLLDEGVVGISRGGLMGCPRRKPTG